ncbi:MAG: SdpI family protein [Aureispira sp.]|nr:SdpI family protein [Aureispira sp.]
MDYPSVLILGLTGLTFILAGAVSFLWPAKEINDWSGYRTKRSRSSQQLWDFAQVYSAKWIMGIGLFMTLLGGFRWCLPLYRSIEIVELIIVVFIIIVIPILMIIKIENKLKKIA